MIAAEVGYTGRITWDKHQAERSAPAMPGREPYQAEPSDFRPSILSVTG